MSATGSRIDLGGMLGWESPHGDMFRRLLVHRNISKYLIELCGEGYRLDHQPLVILQDKESEGKFIPFGHYKGTITVIFLYIKAFHFMVVLFLVMMVFPKEDLIQNFNMYVKMGLFGILC